MFEQQAKSAHTLNRMPCIKIGEFALHCSAQCDARSCAVERNQGDFAMNAVDCEWCTIHNFNANQVGRGKLPKERMNAGCVLVSGVPGLWWYLMRPKLALQTW
jgi:hypothetical protein